MKKKNVPAKQIKDKEDNYDELNDFIRRRNIQNKVLKELIGQLKNDAVGNSDK